MNFFDIVYSEVFYNNPIVSSLMEAHVAEVAYNIMFQVEGREVLVAYDTSGKPRVTACAPGWFHAPNMAPEIAKAMDGGKYPFPITLESFPFQAARFRAATDEKRSVEQIAKDAGLLVDNSGLEEIITQLIDSNPPALTDYLTGKIAALGVLIGMVKKYSKADPKSIRAAIEKKIKEMVDAET